MRISALGPGLFASADDAPKAGTVKKVADGVRVLHEK